MTRDVNADLATPVLIVTFIEVGECDDVVLGGEYLPVHRVTVTDVSAGISLAPGSQFDWFCSCGDLCCGLPNGDRRASVRDAEQEAIDSHGRDGVRFYLDAAHVGRDYLGEEPF
jgi:hypothetical protein